MEGLRYLSALLFMRAILAGPQGTCPTSFLFIAPPSLTPTGCMYVRCLMSQWHQPKMFRKQDLAEYIIRRASTGTCISSYLAKPLPWQIKKKKNLTGTLANSNLHQAPFRFLCELEFPLFFITHHLCSRCTHAITFYKKKEQLNQFSKRHYPEPRPIFRPLTTEFWLLQFPICK